MPDVLIEIGCEELPASACREAIAQVPDLMSAALASQQLPEAAIEVMVGPRRIAVIARDLPSARPARVREVRGPAEQAAFDDAGAPTKAAIGFARGQGVDVAALELRAEGDRRFVYACINDPAVDTHTLVPALVSQIIDGLRFSKNMRWGDGLGLKFSRPVRWIVAKFGADTISCQVHGLVASDITHGHRFLGGPVQISDPDEYRDALRGQGVVADHVERRAEIVTQLDAAAAELGCVWKDPGGKLEEVLFLIERPSVIVGDILPEHLRLPERVLVTAMQSHQRYFPLEKADGTLEPRFLAVSNGNPEFADVIARGNAGVLDARLQDASFSFDRDREVGLGALNSRLDTIVFHKRLGTMAQKRERLATGAAEIATAAGLSSADVAFARRGGELAKVDQGAVLVAEFSDLQGYVGAEYARIEGEDPAVVTAIREHYLPEGADSPLPSSDVAACVSVAEKIDNLVGSFLVGEIPSGSKDPYGLRRAAAGVVRVVLDRGWNISQRELLENAATRHMASGVDLPTDSSDALAQLDEFITDRVVFHVREDGVSAESVAAAYGAQLGSLVATVAWARGLEAARADDSFWAIWTASTRLERLVAKSDGAHDPFVSVGDSGEDSLNTARQAAESAIAAGRDAQDIAHALGALGPLAAAVDQFFTDVLVNDDDPMVRARRYALVEASARAFRQVADFTKITDQGGTR